MSKRLASFHGPSTPSSTPALQPKQPVVPSSPSRATESTVHRKTRTLLQELRSISQTWDDIVLIDGLKAARMLTDARTELDNTLTLLPADSQPRTEIVGPQLAVMDKCIVQLDMVISKLQKQLRRMSAVVDSLEALYHEAQKAKGPRWCEEEPLWVSWPLQKFGAILMDTSLLCFLIHPLVLSLTDITTPYHRSLVLMTDTVDMLRSHSVTFEASRDAINQWVEQPCLKDDGWDAKWEDLFAVEVERWDAR